MLFYGKNNIISDEKNFNLDGPDGLPYYWNDLKTAPEIVSKRLQWKRSVMLWHAISHKGTIDLVDISGRMDAECYSYVLESVQLPAADCLLGDEWIIIRTMRQCIQLKKQKRCLRHTTSMYLTGQQSLLI